MKKIIISLTTAMLFTTTAAFAATPISADIEGTRQGRFKADSPKGIGVAKLFYEMKSSRDMATGQASGKRQHGPVCITKDIGASSPQFFQASVTNEVIKNALFRFMNINQNGEEYVYYTLKLTNATVSNYKQMTGFAYDAATASGKHQYVSASQNQEEICLTFQKIEVLSTDGKTMGMDDWMARP